MWLSEAKRRTETEFTEAALRSVSDADEILRPANILRLPLNNENQLVMNCADGTSVAIGTVSSEIPQGLEAGEIYIETANARLTIKNSGAVNIEGTVNIRGSLTVNGVSVQ